MAGRIPEELIEQIRQRVSIVEVVSGYVALKKSGRNYSGLCPFHQEKSPSFTVNEERGLFHCFGCGLGGTVFTFLMRIDKLEFREAVEQLAKQAGIALPAASARDPGVELRGSMLRANEAAQEYYRSVLWSSRGKVAREYLASRGVAPTMIERYGLGFCPPSGGLVGLLQGKNIGIQVATQLGLLGRRSDGALYDRFWNRITFPIRDSRGRVLGFGGRAMGGEQQPKYLNSPESPLFHKGDVLYGLFEARQAMRDSERVVLVEGYLDAIALVQADIPYTVATLGTALTAVQLRVARRFAAEVVVFFDGDEAGLRAAEKAFASCAEAGVWGLGAFLPAGFDPDTFARQFGTAATVGLLGNAIPLADFFLQRADPGPAATVPQRVRAAKRVAEAIARVEDPVQFGALVKRAAQMLDVDEEVFRRRGAGGVPSSHLPKGAPSASEETSAFLPEELLLVEVMALHPAVIPEVGTSELLSKVENKQLVHAAELIRDAWQQNRAIDSLIDELPAPLATRLRTSLLGEGRIPAGDDAIRIARDCVAAIERRHQRVRMRNLRIRVQQAEARGDISLLKELRDQLRERTPGGA
jgi:DNA primase